MSPLGQFAGAAAIVVCAGSSRCLLLHFSGREVDQSGSEQFTGVSARLWPELLGTSVIGLSSIDVAFLVDRELVNAPKTTGELTESPPRVLQFARSIELEKFVRLPIHYPDALILRDMNIPRRALAT